MTLLNLDTERARSLEEAILGGNLVYLPLHPFPSPNTKYWWLVSARYLPGFKNGTDDTSFLNQIDGHLWPGPFKTKAEAINAAVTIRLLVT